MPFTTSGQVTEWAYSYSPGAHMGLTMYQISCVKAQQSYNSLMVKNIQFNLSKRSGVRWLHFELFSAIQV